MQQHLYETYENMKSMNLVSSGGQSIESILFTNAIILCQQCMKDTTSVVGCDKTVSRHYTFCIGSTV